MRNVKDFNWVLYNGYFDKLVHRENPNLFVFDSGTFIDLENDYNMNGKSVSHPASVLGRLEHVFVVTPKIFEEVMRHREMRIGNRFEISQATALFVHNLHSEYKDLLEIIGVNLINPNTRDTYRYAVYSAAVQAFERDFRKGTKDKISDADREMLEIALYLSKGVYNGKPIGAVNVLTPDEHIARTAKVLRTFEEFKNHKVRVIPTRNDLRSYMER